MLESSKKRCECVRRGHIIVFLDLATYVGGSRTVTCTSAVTSESSRAEHETVLKYRDGTYGNSPSLSLSLSLWELKSKLHRTRKQSTGLHLFQKTLEYHRNRCTFGTNEATTEQPRNASLQDRKHVKGSFQFIFRGILSVLKDRLRQTQSVIILIHEI